MLSVESSLIEIIKKENIHEYWNDTEFITPVTVHDFYFICAWDSILNSNINILNLMTQIGLINHGFCIEGDNAKYLNIEW